MPDTNTTQFILIGLFMFFSMIIIITLIEGAIKQKQLKKRLKIEEELLKSKLAKIKMTEPLIDKFILSEEEIKGKAYSTFYQCLRELGENSENLKIVNKGISRLVTLEFPKNETYLIELFSMHGITISTDKTIIEKAELELQMLILKQKQDAYERKYMYEYFYIPAQDLPDDTLLTALSKLKPFDFNIQIDETLKKIRLTENSVNWDQLTFAPYGKIGKILVKERKEFLNRLQNEMNEIYERKNAWKASVRKMEELLRKGHSQAIDLLNVYNLYKCDIQETPIRNIFEQHEIRLLSDDCSFVFVKRKMVH